MRSDISEHRISMRASERTATLCERATHRDVWLTPVGVDAAFSDETGDTVVEAPGTESVGVLVEQLKSLQAQQERILRLLAEKAPGN